MSKVEAVDKSTVLPSKAFFKFACAIALLTNILLFPEVTELDPIELESVTVPICENNALPNTA